MRRLKTKKMEIRTHLIHDAKIAEVISDDIIISTPNDGFELMANLYYQDFDKIILHAKNISSTFFDLKTGIAGEILQKFSTYRVRLAIVGDFNLYPSKSLKDFIYESNMLKQINFVQTTPEAINALSIK